MRVLWSAVVSSALLFLLGLGGAHPATGAPEAAIVCLELAQAPLAVVEFYPCAVGNDEYLVLSNRAPDAVNLKGWSVSDGEGSITFTGLSLPPGGCLSVSENASSFEAAYGRAPVVHLEGWSTGDIAVVSGRFRLADAGDEVAVLSPDGVVSDAVAYGDSHPDEWNWSGSPIPPLRRGEVMRRAVLDGFTDTDTAADWTLFREFRYGYTGVQTLTASVPAGSVTCFTSPDCSLEVVLGAISGAGESIRLCSYELSSAPVCAHLAEAQSRGVDVRVLVDAMPVGGMSESQVSCLSRLTSSSVDVRVLGGSLDDGVVRHVGAVHSKYIVVDGRTLVALSENFVEDGVPSDRLFGNRGWGVAVDDPGLSVATASLFDDDSRLSRLDVWSWADDPRFDPEAALPDQGQGVHPDGVLSPVTITQAADVAVFVSPDASLEGPFLSGLVSCSLAVTFEQFQAELSWDTRWSDEPSLNPLLASVEGVLHAGGSAQGLLDGSWYNYDGNSESLRFLACSALASGAPPSFGFLANESPVTVLHNKGLVLDDSVIVSSNNWVYPSFARNRELAVAVHSHEASSYFMAAFELDWVPDTTAPVADAGGDFALPTPGTVTLNASGSSDDRAIASMKWDMDGDGEADAFGPRAELHADAIGTYIVEVIVEDAWGNVATDRVVVTVGTGGAPASPQDEAVTGAVWAVPACASAVVAMLLAARKLNLLRPSTRDKA